VDFGVDNFLFLDRFAISRRPTKRYVKNTGADNDSRDKFSRGNASQFFIAGELCRRGYSAVVTLGNTPDIDILCSNQKGRVSPTSKSRRSSPETELVALG
jgi:hypothetical protein